MKEAFRLHQCQLSKPEENVFCWMKKSILEDDETVFNQWKWVINNFVPNRRTKQCFTVQSGDWKSLSLCFFSHVLPPSRACFSSLILLYNVFWFLLNLPLCYWPNWLTLVDCSTSLYFRSSMCFCAYVSWVHNCSSCGFQRLSTVSSALSLLCSVVLYVTVNNVFSSGGRPLCLLTEP